MGDAVRTHKERCRWKGRGNETSLTAACPKALGISVGFCQVQRTNAVSPAEHTLRGPLQTLTLPADKSWAVDGQTDRLWRANPGQTYLPEFLPNRAIPFSGTRLSRQPGVGCCFLWPLPCCAAGSAVTDDAHGLVVGISSCPGGERLVATGLFWAAQVRRHVCRPSHLEVQGSRSAALCPVAPARVCSAHAPVLGTASLHLRTSFAFRRAGERWPCPARAHPASGSR